MNYPFTAEQFIGVMAKYNNAVWPMQIIFYLLALVVVFFVFRQNRYSSKKISAILGGFWLWMGIAYHWIFFTEINPAARIFGTVFVIQGILFLFYGLIKSKLEFKFDKSVRDYIGLGLVVVGLLLYPIIGYIAGHRFPNNPTFGLPCPTTIFTFGLLLLSVGYSKRLIIIPFLWSLLGFMAAISFGIKEDVLLLLSGLIALVVVFFKKVKDSSTAAEI